MIRLYTDSKYYEIEIQHDLLNDIVVVCSYGSRTKNHHHRKTFKVDSLEDADVKVQEILKVRKRHGYVFDRSILNQFDLFY